MVSDNDEGLRASRLTLDMLDTRGVHIIRWAEDSENDTKFARNIEQNNCLTAWVHCILTKQQVQELP